MPDLLLELFSEEIPARMQAQAAASLESLITKKLSEAGISAASASRFHTPRRITLLLREIPELQPDQKIEKKGPKSTAPAEAINGFLASVGLSDISQAELRGDYYFFSGEKKGGKVSELLSKLLPEALAEFTWPKSMRWGESEIRWVRPLKSILCLFGGKTVPFRFGHVESGNKTQGHRFYSSAPFQISSFEDYKSKLLAAKVMLDQTERKKKILEDAKSIAATAGYAPVEDEALLDEVTGLVEWPVLLSGAIDSAFMDIPKEVPIMSMKVNQKYFSMLDASGNLAPKFIITSNIEPSDSGREVIAGNERVLRARLSDAKFFWDNDRKKTLESRVHDLKRITFHAKLGTVEDRMKRMVILSHFIASHIQGADVSLAERAARLAKADLVSGMVGEFPELQGVMGRYLARNDGENPQVAEAIKEHYSPLGPSDFCPKNPVSVSVAIAEKIDTLAGMFRIGEKPTGSKDPYALRRAALGIIRIILENHIRIHPINLVKRALSAYGEFDQKTLDDILEFFIERLKFLLKGRDLRHDIITAAMTERFDYDLCLITAKAEALKTFLASEKGGKLLECYRRAANILKIEEKKDHTSYNKEPDPSLLKQKEESELFQALHKAAPLIEVDLKAENFIKAMEHLAALQPSISAFFEAVTVNDSDKHLRANRLHLLSMIRRSMDHLADFSKIEG